MRLALANKRRKLALRSSALQSTQHVLSIPCMGLDLWEVVVPVQCIVPHLETKGVPGERNVDQALLGKYADADPVMGVLRGRLCLHLGENRRRGSTLPRSSACLDSGQPLVTPAAGRKTTRERKGDTACTGARDEVSAGSVQVSLGTEASSSWSSLERASSPHRTLDLEMLGRALCSIRKSWSGVLDDR